MHYYQFTIGDYTRHTMHLTLMENLAYRLLLDRYYLNELPLELDVKNLARRIGMGTEIDSVKQVLEDFFIETDCGYVNSRCDKEVAAYKAKAGTARVNGNKGGRPKKADHNPEITQLVNSDNPEITQLVNSDNPEITGSKANHKPLTNNQEPLTNNQLITVAEPPKPKQKRFVEPDINEVREYFFEKGETQSTEPQKFHDFYSSKGWFVGKQKMKDWKAAARGWITRNKGQAQQSKTGELDHNSTDWIKSLDQLY